MKAFVTQSLATSLRLLMSKLLSPQIKNNEKQMSDWKDFKRKREIAQKYESDMHRCAIIVQSWWRGQLVRKQLGPYKPRKTKKGKKKA